MLNLEDFDLSEIESIECIGDELTIDITVEDTHMFFANDIYTHNSGFSNDLNGVESIGKAIEVFQKADQVITFSQSPEMKEKLECIAYLLKNRLGQKEIALLCSYDPAKVLFIEKSILNTRVLLSSNEKKKIQTTVSNIREKLKADVYLQKK